MIFSFIFPVNNEEDYLEDQINKFIKSINKKYKNKFGIILVENGSTDNSWLIAKRLEKKYSFIRAHHLPHPSYGTAIKWGILNSNGKKIFILNVDYFDFSFIEKASGLLNIIDIVIGSKTLAGSDDLRPFSRRTFTYFFNVILRLVLNYPGTDTHGIKAFRKSKKLIDCVSICKTQNELFDTELILRLTKSGAIFVDLPQKISELRVSRYFGMRRINSTMSDLISIIKAKYFSKKAFFSSLVDADDFGFSELVNHAIINESNAGSIDIVSIMPNLVKKHELNNLQKSSTSLDFSMHFNLFRGRPCSNPSKVKSLINSKGLFYSLPFFMLRFILGLIEVNEIIIEFKSQYERLLKLGITVKYLNSEQHLHIFSPINKVLENEIKDTSIKKIRSISSSFRSLDGKFFRKFSLFVLKFFCDYRFGKFVEFSRKYDAYIVHPGAKYLLF